MLNISVYYLEIMPKHLPDVLVFLFTSVDNDKIIVHSLFLQIFFEYNDMSFLDVIVSN